MGTIKYKIKAFGSTHNVRLSHEQVGLLQHHRQFIDTGKKIVIGESGTELHYDKLVLSAGIWNHKFLRASYLSELPCVGSLEEFVQWNQMSALQQTGDFQ
jgi:NADH dehydrogenase FAD-containing subunit